MFRIDFILKNVFFLNVDVDQIEFELAISDEGGCANSACQKSSS